jgi:hypothetical protein
MSTVTKVLEDQIETSIFSKSRLSELNELNKVKKLKDYKYKNIIMGNYGESVLDGNNNLIGYKINDNEYATVNTYYDNKNLFCNKVSIQDFDKAKLHFQGNVMTS